MHPNVSCIVRLGRRLALAMVLGAWLLLCPVGASADGSDEKLLMSFEPAEMKELVQRVRARWAAVRPVEGARGFQFKVSYGLWYTCRRGDATQGDHALIAAKGPTDLWARWGKYFPKPHVRTPRRRDPTHLRSGHLFKTFGFFARAFPADWSGYDRLLLDVKSTAAAVDFAVLLEDDRTVLPLGRVFAVPAGKWVTVSFDLARAASEKRLNPARGPTRQPG